MSPKSARKIPALADFKPERRAHFYTRLEIEGANLFEILDLYRDWVLGRGQTFEFARHSRLNVGVPDGWTKETISKPGDFEGHHGTRLRIRQGAGTAILSFYHLDDWQHRKIWESLIRLEQRGSVLTLEHGVRCQQPASDQDPAIEAPPVILRRLLEENRLVIRPAEYLSVRSKQLGEEDVGSFMDGFLFNPQRTGNCVLVAPYREGEKPLVDCADLAKRLRTVASVYELKDRATGFRFSAEFERRGIGKDLSCFDGGVRIYPAGLRRPEAGQSLDPFQCRLWLAQVLLEVREEARTPWIASKVIDWLERRTTPESYWLSIRNFDHEQERLRAAEMARLLDEARAQGGVNPEQILRLQSELEKQRTEAEANWKMAVEEEERRNQLERECERSEQEIEELRQQLQAKSDQLAYQSQEFERLKAENAKDGLPEDVRLAVEDILAGEPVPASCLLAIQALFPVRIDVFPSAFRSATESSHFEKHLRPKLWELIWTLTTDYWQAMQSGQPDAQARKCFGNAYAAKESETTVTNAECERQRTFTDSQGRSHLMLQHLKIGVKDSAAHTLRIHFKWDPESKKILVGHCGRHLKLA